ncbi:MAG: zinc ribbon domain-containing protein [Candidatus Nanopelagicales bacterium]
MKAAPSAQLVLLDLQALDTKLDQLAHRRAGAPQLPQLQELAFTERAKRDKVIAYQTAASDLTGEQERAEREIEVVRERIRRDQARLDSGAVSTARQLEAAQAELANLARRISDLEDAELEAMERLEEATANERSAVADLAVIAETRSDLEAERDRLFADVDAEVARVGGERTRVLGELPPELVTLYDKVRSNSGTGAAALYRGRCEGCQMQLSPADIGRIRAAAPDEVLRCEECRRILVRTPESGL